MSFRSKLARTCLLVLLTASEHKLPAWAEPGLSYSGRLVTADGKPVQGPADLVLRFFDQDSGGTPLIGERMLSAVPLDDGMFEVELNLSPSDLNTVLGNGSTSVYIEISHGPTTYPRQKFAAVPYALRVPIDRTSIIYDDQGRLALGAIPASKISDLATATAGVLGGVSFDQANPTPGKVIKWNGSKYYLDLDNTGGVGGAINATTITTSERAALTLAPYGSGSGETGELRFGELAANGSNYIALKAPDTLASNLVWTLPSRNGASGEMLTTNGSGEFGWSAISNANILDTSITDSKLQTLSTPGKVSGSAITAGTLGGSTAFTGTGGIETLGPITGAGNITLKGRESGSSELRFADQDSSHYLSFKAPATVSNNRTWILPLADGAPGAALTTDGSGNLSWDTPDIASGASIMTSKLSGPLTAIANHGLGTLSLQDAVSSAQIDNFTIVDADIASSASIAGSKISFADDAISGDKVQGGLISDFASVGIDDNAGSLAMTIDSMGHVGIGTTSPISTLHVGRGISTGSVANLGWFGHDAASGIGPNNDKRSTVTIRGTGGNTSGGSSLQLKHLQTSGGTESTARLTLNGVNVTDIPTSNNGANGSLQLLTESTEAIQFATNNTARMTITATGNIGIGTTAPYSSFHLANTGAATTFSLGNASNTQQFMQIGTGADAAGYSYLQASSFNTAWNSLAINPNGGNVGVGTTSPGATLDVLSGASGLRLSAGNGAGGGSNKQIILGYQGTNLFQHLISTRHSDSVPAFNAIDFYLWNKGVDTNPTVGTKHVMSLTGAGDVGIGTKSPLTKLHLVSGNMLLGDGGTDYSSATSYYFGRNQLNNFAANNGFSGIELGGPASGNRGYLAFHTHDLGATSGEKMRIDKLGNVGIGTTSPAAKLTVSGGQAIGTYVASSSSTIDWNQGNIQSTDAAAGTMTFTAGSMLDGGAYTLVLTNNAGGNYTFASTGLTFKCNPACPIVVSTGKETITTMIKAGNKVYVSWVQDFE